MVQLVPITPERHARKRWKRITSYSFAQGESAIPIVSSELANALVSLPIAFLRSGDAFVLAVASGLEPGRNLPIAPDGRFLGTYVPAQLRGYPFRFANAQDGQMVLCIDKASGLISDTEGEPFFTGEGALAPPVAEVVKFLTKVEENRATTQRGVNLLAQHNLIKPWPVAIKGEVGERRIEGLFQVDEAALNQVGAEVLFELRNAGALLIAYCQLLSMQHIHTLGELAKAHARNAQVAQQNIQAVTATPTPEIEIDWSKVKF